MVVEHCGKYKFKIIFLLASKLMQKNTLNNLFVHAATKIRNRGKIHAILDRRGV